jgi:hypothetical protein
MPDALVISLSPPYTIKMKAVRSFEMYEHKTNDTALRIKTSVLKSSQIYSLEQCYCGETSLLSAYLDHCDSCGPCWTLERVNLELVCLQFEIFVLNSVLILYVLNLATNCTLYIVETNISNC